MPTYEYACKGCGEHLEVVQSFTDEPLTECPSCEGPLRKVFGSIGIVFKGTGFYRTDSRMPAKSEKKEPAKAEAKGSDTKAESSSAKESSAGGTTGTSSTKAKTGEKSA